MINALFSNPNWDNPDNDRSGRISELNNNFDDAIALVRDPSRKKEKDIDWNDPWWAAAKRGMEKTRIAYGLDPEGKTSLEVIEHDEAQIKQLKIRQDNIKSMDQS
jgi:hypothetical protein